MNESSYGPECVCVFHSSQSEQNNLIYILVRIYGIRIQPHMRGNILLLKLKNLYKFHCEQIEWIVIHQTNTEQEKN